MQLFPKLDPADRYYYWYLRHSYRGGRDYVYPPLATVHPDRGRILRTVSIEEEDTTEMVGGSSYLLAHGRESPEDFGARRRISYPLRICAPIVNEYVSTILRPRTERAVAREIEEANARVGLHGEPLSQFRESVLRWALVYGLVWVGAELVAPPRVTGGDVETQADAAGRTTRSRVVPPQRALWWSFDDAGNCTGVLVDEGTSIESGSPFDSDRRSILNLRFYTPTEVTTYRAEVRDCTGTEAANYAHLRMGALEAVATEPGPGFVPFVPVAFRRSETSDSPAGESLIEGAADIQHDIYNHRSWIQSIHRDQGFPVLGVPYELGEGKVGRLTQISLSTKRALPFLAGTQPVWLSPPMEQAQEMRDYCNEAIEYARTDAGVGRRSDSAQVASGKAEEWQHAPFFANCKGGAEMMTSWETAWNGHRLALVRGTTPNEIDPAECRAQYGTDFEPADLDRVVDRLDKVLKVGVGGVFDREMKRQAARQVFADADDDTRTEIDDDIVERSEREEEAAKVVDEKIIASAGQAPAQPPPPRFGAPRPVPPQAA